METLKVKLLLGCYLKQLLSNVCLHVFKIILSLVTYWNLMDWILSSVMLQLKKKDSFRSSSTNIYSEI